MNPMKGPDPTQNYEVDYAAKALGPEFPNKTHQ